MYNCGYSRSQLVLSVKNTVDQGQISQDFSYKVLGDLIKKFVKFEEKTL